MCNPIVNEQLHSAVRRMAFLAGMFLLIAILGLAANFERQENDVVQEVWWEPLLGKQEGADKRAA